MKLVVLGWFAESQLRIKFIKHLLDASDLSIAEANLPVEIRDVTHPFALGRQLAACGAEVRVVRNEAQLAEIRGRLVELDWELPRAHLERMVRAVAPELRPGT